MAKAMNNTKVMKSPSKMKMSVDVRQAQNGYIVSTCDKDYNTINYIASTSKDAQALVAKLLK